MYSLVDQLDCKTCRDQYIGWGFLFIIILGVQVDWYQSLDWILVNRIPTDNGTHMYAWFGHTGSHSVTVGTHHI